MSTTDQRAGDDVTARVTLDAVCAVIGATEATVVEKAVAYMERLHQAEQQAARYAAALSRIANEDYRGPRPFSASVAWEALNRDQ